VNILPEPYPHPVNPSFKDLTGQSFSRLRVLYLSGMKPYGKQKIRLSTWLCLCDCGNHHETTGRSLLAGDTKSCGCLHRYVMAHKSLANITHGRSNTPEYRSWAKLKGRCLNPNDKSYERYGGRGIAVCDRWVNSFENFFADMGPRPSPKHSLDRINNDGDYTPENCRWATAIEQVRNSSHMRWITYKGETLCLKDWAERIGISKSALIRRFKEGCSTKEALETPRWQTPKRSQD